MQGELPNKFISLIKFAKSFLLLNTSKNSVSKIPLCQVIGWRMRCLFYSYWLRTLGLHRASKITVIIDWKIICLSYCNEISCHTALRVLSNLFVSKMNETFHHVCKHLDKIRPDALPWERTQEGWGLYNKGSETHEYLLSRDGTLRIEVWENHILSNKRRENITLGGGHWEIRSSGGVLLENLGFWR